MESPWHVGSGPLLKAGYIAARGGQMLDFYVGVNMFVYYSWKQVRNQEYKGPDVYFVKDVDGQKPRLYWAIWDEDGRYPDVVIELLSPTTEQQDLTSKLEIYRQKFHVTEYFCVAPQCERIIGWKSGGDVMEPLRLDERGWMWSDYLGLWIGPWHGFHQGEERIWPRFYHADGSLVWKFDNFVRTVAQNNVLAVNPKFRGEGVAQVVTAAVWVKLGVIQGRAHGLDSFG